MENKFIKDPWARTKTRNGLNGDEVISSLQKSIRRGLVEQACEFAYEMYITSPQMEEKLWRRLLTISVEDIGMGDPNAAILVNNLNQMRKEFTYGDGDRPIYFIHAIRYLCQCEKDRSSDLLKNIVIKSFAMGHVPEIPDIALDKHTVRGAAMGRDSFHFLNEASIVIPQKQVDNDYKERYEKILHEYDPDKAVESAFKFDPWQY
jgi:replication-associated recombination protein RarA